MKSALAIILFLAATLPASGQQNRFASTVFKVLTNDISITNETNGVVIDALTFATEPNARYHVTFIPFTSAAVTGTQLQVLATNATPVGTWNNITVNFASTNPITNVILINSTAARGVFQSFYVLGGTNTGTVTVAMSSSVATNTNTMHAGSFMRADRVPQ